MQPAYTAYLRKYETHALKEAVEDLCYQMSELTIHINRALVEP